MMPGDPAICAEAKSAFAGQESLEPERDGLKLLEIQRRHVLTVPGAAADFAIAGRFAEHTSVRPNTITLRILAR